MASSHGRPRAVSAIASPTPPAPTRSTRMDPACHGLAGRRRHRMDKPAQNDPTRRRARTPGEPSATASPEPPRGRHRSVVAGVLALAGVVALLRSRTGRAGLRAGLVTDELALPRVGDDQAAIDRDVLGIRLGRVRETGLHELGVACREAL